MSGIYTLSEAELSALETDTGLIYDLANVALALLDGDLSGYRARKNLQTVITAIRDHNSQTHTMAVMTRLAAEQAAGRSA